MYKFTVTVHWRNAYLEAYSHTFSGIKFSSFRHLFYNHIVPLLQHNIGTLSVVCVDIVAQSLTEVPMTDRMASYSTNTLAFDISNSPTVYVYRMRKISVSYHQ